MTIEDDIAFLERIPILRRLGAGALRILAISTESYTVEEGQVLFNAGYAADCAYVVQDGSFTLTSGRLNEDAGRDRVSIATCSLIAPSGS